eukprot:scaffold13341_cov101-Isochrysis_galbana.AAC.6
MTVSPRAGRAAVALPSSAGALTTIKPWGPSMFSYVYRIHYSIFGCRRGTRLHAATPPGLQSGQLLSPRCHSSRCRAASVRSHRDEVTSSTADANEHRYLTPATPRPATLATQAVHGCRGRPSRRA